MIVALLMGRKRSQGLPKKNTYEILGHPLAYYPMQTARQTPEISKTYLSTDDPELMKIARSLGVEIIERPDYLCTNTALGEDVFKHGFEEIKQRNSTIEMVVLLMCNAATVSTQIIREGIQVLREKSEIDSAVTVSKYNMWSPLRARKIDAEGLLQPFVPFETFGDPESLSCDRDSQGDVWYADMGVSVVRPSCLERMEDGLLPQKWMGHNIYPLIQEAGCDVDYEWQFPIVEWWLKKNGIVQ